MDMEDINYKKGKPAFNKFLIKIFGNFYCGFNLRRLHVKIKKLEGNVSHKGGILIASHHEDDADPFVINFAIRRRLNWISATKIFGKSLLDNQFLKKMCDMFGVITIDINNPKRNEGLFDYVTYLLEIGEAVVIFPEGNLRVERDNKRLGKAKDGVIRIAQLTQRKINRKIPIYPVGIEYREKKDIKEAYIRIGDPFFIKNGEDSKIVITKLMKEIARLSNIKSNMSVF